MTGSVACPASSDQHTLLRLAALTQSSARVDNERLARSWEAAMSVASLLVSPAVGAAEAGLRSQHEKTHCLLAEGPDRAVRPLPLAAEGAV